MKWMFTFFGNWTFCMPIFCLQDLEYMWCDIPPCLVHNSSLYPIPPRLHWDYSPNPVHAQEHYCQLLKNKQPLSDNCKPGQKIRLIKKRPCMQCQLIQLITCSKYWG